MEDISRKPFTCSFEKRGIAGNLFGTTLTCQSGAIRLPGSALRFVEVSSKSISGKTSVGSGVSCSEPEQNGHAKCSFGKAFFVGPNSLGRSSRLGAKITHLSDNQSYRVSFMTIAGSLEPTIDCCKLASSSVRGFVSGSAVGP